MTENDLQMIFKALRFAAHVHRKQKRKGKEGSPYINHVIEVAETLIHVAGSGDAALITAAILHDTVEDTKTTPEEIEREFGSEVSGIVAEVTDDKSLDKNVRKQLQIENAPHKSPKAKLLKIADKSSNIAEIRRDPPVGWDHTRRAEYLDWAEKVVAGLRGANPALDAFFDKQVASTRKSILAADAN